MRRTLTLALLAAVVFATALTQSIKPAEAQEFSTGLTVVAIDRQSISSNSASIGLVNSFLNLMFHLRDRQTFAFVFVDDFTNPIGPLQANMEEFHEIVEQVESTLASSPPSEEIALSAVLAETHNYARGLSADPNSDIIIVTGGRSTTSPEPVLDRVGPVIDLFVESGWDVLTVSAPGIDDGLKTVLEEISRQTGGESFNLSVPAGFETITDRILRRDGKGSLSSMGRAVLSEDSVLEVDLDIAPGTSEVNMVFFREIPVTSFRLRNPDGFEASVGDRTSSSISEFPNVVVWELIDPVPGRWNVQIRGTAGHFSANRHSVNRFSIEHQSYGIVPIGEPVMIVAAVMDGLQRSTVDADLSAVVTDPEGTAIIHELNDQGRDGDAIAGDGYFSAMGPPVNLEGEYAVKLQLSWPDISFNITTHSSFSAQSFPIVSVSPIETGIIQPGHRTKIATLFVNVDGQPFSVLVDDLNASTVSNQGESGKVEIVPQEVISLGKAFAFDVFFTPSAESMATVIVRLDVEYADRMFTYSPDQIVVSSVSPRPTPVPPPPAPTPEPAAKTPSPPALPDPDVPPTGLIAIIVVLCAVGLVVAGFAAYWATRTAPFGYLYSNDGEVLVNFASLRRAVGDVLFRRNTIWGNELDIPGFREVSFRFGVGRVFVESTQVSPSTVRVNNQPVTDSVDVFDNSWIGASGRLYRFTYRPRPSS